MCPAPTTLKAAAGSRFRFREPDPLVYYWRYWNNDIC
jgi:hypothetical protein